MPPNKKKKKGSSTNKKNKGRAAASLGSAASAAGGTGAGPRQSSSTGGSSSSSVDCDSTLRQRLLQSRVPIFHRDKSNTDSKDQQQREDALPPAGYYEIYKSATLNFQQWMKTSVPGGARVQSVKDLTKGADAIMEHNLSLLDQKQDSDNHGDGVNDNDNSGGGIHKVIRVPAKVLQQLETSIYYRREFTKDRLGDAEGGDDGHRYLVDALCYCRSILSFSRQVTRVIQSMRGGRKMDGDAAAAPSTTTTPNVDGIGGRFQALSVEEEDEEEPEDDDEEDKAMQENIRQGQIPKFEAPPAPKEDVLLDVLIQGDDRFQAVALLQTMDDLMATVDGHYGMLKRLLRGQQEHCSSSPMQLMLECAMVTNLATDTVRVAENALQAQHPHLSSFYHVLAIVFLTPYVADVESKMRENASTAGKLEREPHMVLHYVASIVECSFHNRGDDRIPAKVKRFTKKSGLPLAWLQTATKGIHFLTSLEVQLFMEEAANADLTNMLQRKPHTWLQYYSFIGNDRCILNTQTLVQKVLDALEDHTKLVGKRGWWGQEFDEQSKSASKIRGGLDEAFAGCILPELIEVCRRKPFEILPERTQLFTILDLLQRHLKQNDRTEPVPVALTFGLHAMMTSIFILQGDGDLARIASYTKESYNNLFAQLGELSDAAQPPENSPTFYANLTTFKNLVEFAKPVSISDPRIQSRLPDILDPAVAVRLALWNPVIGGEYLLYATYTCSIGLGSATVDSLGQLRFTLHLYNAIRQLDSSLEEKLPFLKSLDGVFAKTKAVWVGGRPEQGSFAKHFWMAWGMNIPCATKLASECELDEDKVFSKRSRDGMIRDLKEIRPEDYSSSYRRLVLQDFQDEDSVADFTLKRASKEQRKENAAVFDLLTRVNITRDSMDDDEGAIMPVNFSAVGCILLDFTNALSKHMGWDAFIDSALKEFPEFMRTADKTMGGKKITPGSFNASDLNLKRQGMAHLWGNMMVRLDNESGNGDRSYLTKASDFMVNYFQGIHSDRYKFFVEKMPSTSARRNPLEGAYPYGRTGRTVGDPLQSFIHFKYGKRGSYVTRLIKPGKCTPLIYSQNGEIETPYEERGSKLPRVQGGKYRHIASYSLDELIDLGWDGAKYVSTKGRHTASGHYVPFVVGYDSDSGDEYEPIDIQRGRRSGTVGLPPDEVGLFMAVSDLKGGRNLVKIKNGRGC